MSVSDSNSPAFTQMVPLAHHEAEVARLTAERDADLAGAVKVKPLVWPDFRDGGTCGHPHHFQYFVTQDHHGSFWAHFDTSQHKTLDAAKAHCDHHYQRAAIQPDPEARQADLAKAFCMGRDAAAAIPADHAEYARKRLGATTHPQYASDWSIIVSRCDMIVDAIRALLPPADLAARLGDK